MLATRRGSAAQRGYDRLWERVALLRRQMDCYLCQECHKRGVLTPSSIVDHIIPIDVRPDWRLEIGNTQVLCVGCHAVKTAEDKRRYGLRGTMNERRQAVLQLVRPPREGEGFRR
jgi:5-methylcytosine-specific restriction endonuclease McrA